MTFPNPIVLRIEEILKKTFDSLPEKGLSKTPTLESKPDDAEDHKSIELAKFYANFLKLIPMIYNSKGRLFYEDVFKQDGFLLLFSQVIGFIEDKVYLGNNTKQIKRLEDYLARDMVRACLRELLQAYLMNPKFSELKPIPFFRAFIGSAKTALEKQALEFLQKKICKDRGEYSSNNPYIVAELELMAFSQKRDHQAFAKAFEAPLPFPACFSQHLRLYVQVILTHRMHELISKLGSKELKINFFAKHYLPLVEKNYFVSHGGIFKNTELNPQSLDPYVSYQISNIKYIKFLEDKYSAVENNFTELQWEQFCLLVRNLHGNPEVMNETKNTIYLVDTVLSYLTCVRSRIHSSPDKPMFFEVATKLLPYWDRFFDDKNAYLWTISYILEGLFETEQLDRIPAALKSLLSAAEGFSQNYLYLYGYSIVVLLINALPKAAFSNNESPLKMETSYQGFLKNFSAHFPLDDLKAKKNAKEDRWTRLIDSEENLFGHCLYVLERVPENHIQNFGILSPLLKKTLQEKTAFLQFQIDVLTGLSPETHQHNIFLRTLRRIGQLLGCEGTTELKLDDLKVKKLPNPYDKVRENAANPLPFDEKSPLILNRKLALAPLLSALEKRNLAFKPQLSPAKLPLVVQGLARNFSDELCQKDPLVFFHFLNLLYALLSLPLLSREPGSLASMNQAMQESFRSLTEMHAFLFPEASLQEEKTEGLQKSPVPQKNLASQITGQALQVYAYIDQHSPLKESFFKAEHKNKVFLYAIYFTKIAHLAGQYQQKIAHVLQSHAAFASANELPFIQFLQWQNDPLNPQFSDIISHNRFVLMQLKTRPLLKLYLENKKTNSPFENKDWENVFATYENLSHEIIEFSTDVPGFMQNDFQLKNLSLFLVLIGKIPAEHHPRACAVMTALAKSQHFPGFLKETALLENTCPTTYLIASSLKSLKETEAFQACYFGKNFSDSELRQEKSLQLALVEAPDQQKWAAFAPENFLHAGYFKPEIVLDIAILCLNHPKQMAELGAENLTELFKLFLAQLINPAKMMRVNYAVFLKNAIFLLLESKIDRQPLNLSHREINQLIRGVSEAEATAQALEQIPQLLSIISEKEPEGLYAALKFLLDCVKGFESAVVGDEVKESQKNVSTFIQFLKGKAAFFEIISQGLVKHFLKNYCLNLSEALLAKLLRLHEEFLPLITKEEELDTYHAALFALLQGLNATQKTIAQLQFEFITKAHYLEEFAFNPKEDADQTHLLSLEEKPKEEKTSEALVAERPEESADKAEIKPKQKKGKKHKNKAKKPAQQSLPKAPLKSQEIEALLAEINPNIEEVDEANSEPELEKEEVLASPSNRGPKEAPEKQEVETVLLEDASSPQEETCLLEISVSPMNNDPAFVEGPLEPEAKPQELALPMPEAQTQEPVLEGPPLVNIIPEPEALNPVLADLNLASPEMPLAEPMIGPLEAKLLIPEDQEPSSQEEDATRGLETSEAQALELLPQNPESLPRDVILHLQEVKQALEPKTALAYGALGVTRDASLLPEPMFALVRLVLEFAPEARAFLLGTAATFIFENVPEHESDFDFRFSKVLLRPLAEHFRQTVHRLGDCLKFAFREEIENPIIHIVLRTPQKTYKIDIGAFETDKPLEEALIDYLNERDFSPASLYVPILWPELAHLPANTLQVRGSKECIEGLEKGLMQVMPIHKPRNVFKEDARRYFRYLKYLKTFANRYQPDLYLQSLLSQHHIRHYFVNYMISKGNSLQEIEKILNTKKGRIAGDIEMLGSRYGHQEAPFVMAESGLLYSLTGLDSSKGSFLHQTLFLLQHSPHEDSYAQRKNLYFLLGANFCIQNRLRIMQDPTFLDKQLIFHIITCLKPEDKLQLLHIERQILGLDRSDKYLDRPEAELMQMQTPADRQKFLSLMDGIIHTYYPGLTFRNFLQDPFAQNLPLPFLIHILGAMVENMSQIRSNSGQIARGMETLFFRFNCMNVLHALMPGPVFFQMLGVDTRDRRVRATLPALEKYLSTLRSPYAQRAAVHQFFYGHYLLQNQAWFAARPEELLNTELFHFSYTLKRNDDKYLHYIEKITLDKTIDRYSLAVQDPAENNWVKDGDFLEMMEQIMNQYGQRSLSGRFQHSVQALNASKNHPIYSASPGRPLNENRESKNTSPHHSN